MDKRLKLISLFFVNVILFVCLSFVLPIRFEENDDVMMCMIANGIISGHPDYHLVFINTFIGRILAGLYSLCHTIEWYTLMLAIVQIISITIIDYLLLIKSTISSTIKIISFILIYILWISIIARFQFTTTAGIGTLSGALLLLHKTKHSCIIGGSLILIGAMLRFNAACLVLLLLTPLFLEEIYNNKRMVFVYSSILCLLVVIKLIDFYSYKDDEWAQYATYNQLRGWFNDNPNAALGYHYLPENIDKKDYQNLLSFCPDNKVVNTQVLTRIQRSIKLDLIHNHGQLLSNMRQIIKYRIPTVVILIGLLLIIIRTTGGGEWFAPVFAIILFGCIMIGLCLNTTLKNRVYMCILMVMLFYLIYYSSYVSYKWMIGLLICLILKYGYQNYKVCHKQKIPISSDAIELLSQVNKVYYTPSLSYETLNPFLIHKFPRRIIGLGWLAKIPLCSELQDGYQGFLNENVLILCGQNNDVTNIKQELLRVYHIETKEVIIAQNERYQLLKIIKAYEN